MKVSVSLRSSITFAAVSACAAPVFAQLHPSVETDMYSPQNSTKLIPDAPLGSQYPTHGNAQTGDCRGDIERVRQVISRVRSTLTILVSRIVI